jgi:hypothetical protein
LDTDQELAVVARDGFRDRSKVDFPLTFQIPGAFLVWPLSPEGEGKPAVIETTFTRARLDEANRAQLFPERKLAGKTLDRQYGFLALSDLVQGEVSDATPRFRYLAVLEFQRSDGKTSVVEVGFRLRGPLPQLRVASWDRAAPPGWDSAVKTGRARLGQEIFENPSRSRWLQVRVEAQGELSLNTTRSCQLRSGGGERNEMDSVARARVRAPGVLSAVSVTVGSEQRFFSPGSGAEFRLAPGERALVGYWGSLSPAAPLKVSQPLPCGCFGLQVLGENLEIRVSRQTEWSESGAVRAEEVSQLSERRDQWEFRRGTQDSRAPLVSCSGYYS